MDSPIIDPNHFWNIIARFPAIRTYKDLRAVVASIESNNEMEQFPNTHRFLVKFIKDMNRHIYEEFHLEDD